MSIEEAKVVVRNKYPRAKCFWREFQEGFVVMSYRCGQPITNTGEPTGLTFKWNAVVFPTQNEAWIAAARAIQNASDGDLEK